MGTLHHELNYVTSRIAMKRMLIFSVVWIALILSNSEPSDDWRDEFDTKYMRKVYGSLEDGAVEGGEDD